MLDEYTCHLHKARQQREYYRERCLLSKELFQTHDLNQTERGQVCTMDMTQMYSFDFAQQIHYPHHAQEVGALFFKTPRKCQAFCVCAEGAGEQVFYLVDEAEEARKKNLRTMILNGNRHTVHLPYPVRGRNGRIQGGEGRWVDI